MTHPASPAQGEPLTDEHIERLAKKYEVGSRESDDWGFAWHDFARAVERAALSQGEPHAGSAEPKLRAALEHIIRRLQMDIDDGGRPDQWSMEDLVRTANAALADPPQAGAKPPSVDLTERDSTAIRRAADDE